MLLPTRFTASSGGLRTNPRIHLLTMYQHGRDSNTFGVIAVHLHYGKPVGKLFPAGIPDRRQISVLTFEKGLALSRPGNLALCFDNASASAAISVLCSIVISSNRFRFSLQPGTRSHHNLFRLGVLCLVRHGQRFLVLSFRLAGLASPSAAAGRSRLNTDFVCAHCLALVIHRLS